MPPETKFDEWVAAERVAGAAERELYAALLDPAPSMATQLLDNQARFARAKRATAHILFKEAMQEMRAITAALHHRRVVTPPRDGAEHN